MKWKLAFGLVLFCVQITVAQDITIMIDPGHGGSDPGHEAVLSNQKDEKELTLIIAQKFGTYLEEKLNHVTVLYTRTDDSYPTLEERVAMANAKKVDYFISIHLNGSPDITVKGTESHIHTLDSKKALRLATLFEQEFKNRAGRKSRGIKDTDDRTHSLQVLKFTNMTSVLVECGFLTNTSESKYLNTENGQDIIASALFRATRTFLKETHKDIDFTVKEEKKKEENNGNYSVQILSSKTWIDTEDDAFKKIKHKIIRKQVAQTGYKYVYFAGQFSSLQEAESALKEIQKSGFPDAFVVKTSG